MATTPHPAPAAPPRRESRRITLARRAVHAAGSVPGVTGTDAGRTGQHATFAGIEPIAGVTVIADADGRYAVDLYLTASPTDLRALGRQVERAVRAAASSDDLGHVVGGVHVTFTDLTIPKPTDGA